MSDNSFNQHFYLQGTESQHAHLSKRGIVLV